MIIGNVQGMLVKYLDDYDVISPTTDDPCPALQAMPKGCDIKQDIKDAPQNKCKPRLTWGPFTLYRNIPRITELFKTSVHGLYKLMNVKCAMFIDEWGGQCTRATSPAHAFISSQCKHSLSDTT
jgi:hypothetical protein